MLSICAMGRDRADYYLSLAQEDYYLKGGEPLGKWCGKGAEQLGITGDVKAEDLRALIDGFSPRGEALVQNAGTHGPDGRKPGWDLTFSTPKPVSVLWSLADEETRHIIQQAHFSAVKTAIEYLEHEVVWTRRGTGGGKLERCGLVAATFEHGTSRALDAELHTHAVLINLGVREDGTTGAILSQQIFDHKLTAGALYRAHLAAQLERTLHVTCKKDRDFFTLNGVSRELCRTHSKRRDEIVAELRSKGFHSAAAAAIVALETRQAKSDVPPRTELFARWRKLAEEHGQELSAILSNGRDARFDRALDARELVPSALERLTEAANQFRKQDLLRTVAVAAQVNALDACQVRAAVDEALAHSKEIVRLGRDGDEEWFTTRSVLKLEEGLLQKADALHRLKHHGVRGEIIEEVLAKYKTPRSAIFGELKHHAKQLVNAAKKKKTILVDREKLRKDSSLLLSDEQKNAVRHLTDNTRGGIRLMEGWAGTTKTTTLKVAAEVWQKGGYRVVGTAVAGKAVKGLKNKAGIEAYTLAKLDFMLSNTSLLKRTLRHEGRQLVRALKGKRRSKFKIKPWKLDSKTVLIIDEGSMCSTSQLHRIVTHALKAGAKVVAVGDRAQLPAIGRGGGFASFADRFGAAQLTTVLRQKEEWMRDTVRQFREGDAAGALEQYAKANRIHIADNREKAVARLVSDWAQREGKRCEDALIFAGTRQEVHDINTRCQKARLLAGDVKRYRHTTLQAAGLLKSTDKEKTRFQVYEGDRVLFTKGSPKIGLENGDIGTVVRIKKALWPIGDSLIVKLDTKELVNVSLRNYEGVRLGYAITVHKGQGQTVARGYVLAGGRMTSRQLTYVQMTRSEQETWIYADGHEAGAGMTQLAQQMNKSQEQQLAHDAQKRRASATARPARDELVDDQDHRQPEAEERRRREERQDASQQRARSR